MNNKQFDVLVYIGFDERQPEAFKVCKQSILSLSKPGDHRIHVLPLKHQELRDRGIFTRPWKITENGAFLDERDGKPFSTQFSHTRFLVPYLARTSDLNPRFAIFVDSDFVFLRSISELINEILSDKGHFPVYCVKHNYKPSADRKMDNRDQFGYNKKLWTSLMVFDMEEDHSRALTPAHVNSATGMSMHQFQWLLDEALIGSIDESWNAIPGHTFVPRLSAIHYTEGTPHMPGYENCPWAEYYWMTYQDALVMELNNTYFKGFLSGTNSKTKD